MERIKSMLDDNALRAACYEVACQTLWEMEPVDNEAAKKALANSFYEAALFHLEYIEDRGHDPNMLVRAVVYLAHTHALPPMRDDTRWFHEMLGALVELACPNAGQIAKSAQFLNDIERGIREARQDLNKHTTSGYIYIAINESFGGRIKIGKTSRKPEERAAELSRPTGVPTKFHVAYDEFVSDYHLAEKLVHKRLEDFRVRKSREFFDIPVKDAIKVLAEVAKEIGPG